MFILGWIPNGRATSSATASSWSLAGLVHVPAESAFVIILAQQQNLHLGGIALDHLPQHQEWGSSPSSARLCRSCSYTLIHTTGMPLPPLGSVEVPRSRHFSIFCTWNWGPQLQFTAASNGGYAGIWGRWEAAVCGWMATAIAPQRWILIPVATALLIADGPEFL